MRLGEAMGVYEDCLLLSLDEGITLHLRPMISPYHLNGPQEKCLRVLHLKRDSGSSCLLPTLPSKSPPSFLNFSDEVAISLAVLLPLVVYYEAVE